MIEAGSIGEKDARLLEIKENIPVLVIKRLTYLENMRVIEKLIPDFIELGVDILNPVQASAADMDTKQLKREFGHDITFWGGGCDTQKILPFGTPEDVKNEVKRRIGDLSPGGGLVFAPVHNIQPDVQSENIVVIYQTALENGGYNLH